MDQKKQIEEMNAEIREAVNGCSSYWSGLIAEHLYEQGWRRQSKNTIELPCKAGDIIYRIVGNKIVTDIVLKIEIASNDRITIFYNWHGMAYEMSSADQIGKTIFLTEEEAELAKKGGAE